MPPAPRLPSSTRRRAFAFAALALGLAPPAALVVACTGDDDVFHRPDAGVFDGAIPDRAVRPPEPDGAAPLSCGDGGSGPPRALVTYGTTTGELAVVNLETRAVDGRLAFDGGYGFAATGGTEPYLLGGASDVVTRLDPREPWRPVASWNVRGDDGIDGGLPNANPVAIATVSCSKAYVLRFNRDRIAVIDPSQPGGGVPLRYIDLSTLREPADPNVLEATSAVYVPSKKRVYVLLGNADLTQTIESGFKIRCTALRPSIVAIDVETDAIVNLGGTGRGGGIQLEGYNPPVGTPLVYDAAFDRLLVLEAGCNVPHDDGGAGDIVRRRVEQVDLATGAVKTLLPLDDRAFPSTLAFASGERAAIAFYFEGLLWDPRQPTLGEPIPGGMDLVAHDGRGGFVGTRSTFLRDGGSGPLEVVTVPPGDGGPSVVARDPFTLRGGFVGNIQVWP